MRLLSESVHPSDVAEDSLCVSLQYQDSSKDSVLLGFHDRSSSNGAQYGTSFQEMKPFVLYHLCQNLQNSHNDFVYTLKTDASAVSLKWFLCRATSDVDSPHCVIYFSTKLKKHQQLFTIKEEYSLVIPLRKFECYIPQETITPMQAQSTQARTSEFFYTKCSTPVNEFVDFSSQNLQLNRSNKMVDDTLQRYPS